MYSQVVLHALENGLISDKDIRYAAYRELGIRANDEGCVLVDRDDLRSVLHFVSGSMEFSRCGQAAKRLFGLLREEDNR